MDLFSYWSGPITWMERLSAASAASVGHRLTVFSYDPKALRAEGLDGVEIADARDVFSDPAIDGIRTQLPSHFVDHFRLEGLARNIGIWADLDVLFLKPIAPAPYIMGWGARRRRGTEFVGAAVLRLLPDSPILADYLALCRRRPVDPMPPWWSSWDRLRYRSKQAWRAMQGAYCPPPYGMPMPYGPPALTHFVHKHGLVNEVAPQAVYYPVLTSDGLVLIDPAAPTDWLTPEVVAVHLWHNFYRQRLGREADEPPRTGWLGEKCREFGLAGSVASARGEQLGVP